jgi:hypothetical protein
LLFPSEALVVKKQRVKLNVVAFKARSRNPCRIIKLTNFNKGISKVFEYSDLLFLKQVGRSTIFEVKKALMVEWRKNRKLLLRSTLSVISSKSSAGTSLISEI